MVGRESNDRRAESAAARGTVDPNVVGRRSNDRVRQSGFSTLAAASVRLSRGALPDGTGAANYVARTNGPTATR
jgi:hypothetical protein